MGVFAQFTLALLALGVLNLGLQVSHHAQSEAPPPAPNDGIIERRELEKVARQLLEVNTALRHELQLQLQLAAARNVSMAPPAARAPAPAPPVALATVQAPAAPQLSPPPPHHPPPPPQAAPPSEAASLAPITSSPAADCVTAMAQRAAVYSMDEQLFARIRYDRFKVPFSTDLAVCSVRQPAPALLRCLDAFLLRHCTGHIVSDPSSAPQMQQWLRSIAGILPGLGSELVPTAPEKPASNRKAAAKAAAKQGTARPPRRRVFIAACLYNNVQLVGPWGENLLLFVRHLRATDPEVNRRPASATTTQQQRRDPESMYYVCQWARKANPRTYPYPDLRPTCDLPTTYLRSRRPSSRSTRTTARTIPLGCSRT